MISQSYLDHFLELQQSGVSFITVTIVDAVGSTPQDAGSKMIVNQEGLVYGTVGGGRVEAKAIDFAKDILKNDEHPQTAFVEWNLQKDVGMTCGGVVKLFFEKVNQGDWRIVIFGAGHVTQSLVKVLIHLPCKIICIDPRSEWLSKLPKSPNLNIIQSDDPKSEVSKLSKNDFVLCITRGHRTDFPVLLEIFKNKIKFEFLGVIGSKTKAATLRKELTEEGIESENIKFHCPIGLPLGTNHPGEIAISIASQLLQQRDLKKHR